MRRSLTLTLTKVVAYQFIRETPVSPLPLDSRHSNSTGNDEFLQERKLKFAPPTSCLKFQTLFYSIKRLDIFSSMQTAIWFVDYYHCQVSHNVYFHEILFSLSVTGFLSKRRHCKQPAETWHERISTNERESTFWLWKLKFCCWRKKFGKFFFHFNSGEHMKERNETISDRV